MPRAKTKKQSKLSKLTRVFNLSTNKGRLLSFVLLFALVGGAYMVYQSYAATTPPISMRTPIGMLDVKASDGVVGDLHCISVTGATGYGPLANCLQRKPGTTKYRKGLYSPITAKFNPDTNWLDSYDGLNVNVVCKNMNYYFAGEKKLATVYGPVSYGQIYRSYRNPDTKAIIWQIKWATYSSITGGCSVNGSWMNASMFSLKGGAN